MKIIAKKYYQGRLDGLKHLNSTNNIKKDFNK